MNQELAVDNKKSKNKLKRILLISLIVILIILCYLGFRAWSFLQNLNDGLDVNLLEKPLDDEPLNVLILGVDHVPGRSDTMILASYNPNTGKVLALSIPRDTRVEIPGYWKSSGKPYGERKINSAHSHGGIPLAIETVEQFLNVNIHYYARLDYSTLHRLVDAIGGVPVEVKRYMYYDDNAVNLHIRFQPGEIVLDGQKAEEFLRWRKNSDGTGDELGDIGRVQRQQAFIKSALYQLLKLKNVMKLGELESIVNSGVTTNMSASFMLKMFTDVVLGIDIENDINFVTAPGRCPRSDWIIEGDDRVKLDEILQSHYAPNITETINVKVINSANDSELTNDVVNKLNSYAFINATLGDTASEKAVTEVYSYCDTEVSKYVASLLNAQYNMCKGNNTDTNQDVIIYLGKDYIKED